MWKNKYQITLVVALLTFIQPVVSPDTAAFARKRTPMRAYSFIAEGGKASQGECDGEKKIPRLKRVKEFAKTSTYLGSELQKPEIPGKTNEEMWKHFYKVKASCNSALAKTPSSLAEVQKEAKVQIPEEPEDSEVETEKPEAAETEATEGAHEAN